MSNLYRNIGNWKKTNMDKNLVHKNKQIPSQQLNGASVNNFAVWGDNECVVTATVVAKPKAATPTAVTRPKVTTPKIATQTAVGRPKVAVPTLTECAATGKVLSPTPSIVATAAKSKLNPMAPTFTPRSKLQNFAVAVNGQEQTQTTKEINNSRSVTILQRHKNLNFWSDGSSNPQPKKTLEERKKAYSVARLRILGTAKNPKD